jgi:hypothetical protein
MSQQRLNHITPFIILCPTVAQAEHLIRYILAPRGLCVGPGSNPRPIIGDLLHISPHPRDAR